ncbi:uncharacterized protein [Mytilus edulis]|uniref:uncharacterized protein n=1 Tax=Mytilus edulis TaxID=6550 RepID=UPI0039F0A868
MTLSDDNIGLEKSRQTHKNISALTNEKGEIITDSSEILKLEKNFYENLYKSTNPNENEIKKYITETKVDKTLSHEETQNLEGELTIKECTEAIKSMKLNKSPGIDGISVEFYRTFWTNLKEIVVKVFNTCYQKEEMSTLQKIGVVSLLYKKGNPLLLDNYRPITLLNVDTKLMAYSLAQRLKPILTKIIHSDQNGYIKNRYIGFNIRQIQDIIDHAEYFNIEGALLFIDFSKAFDSLEWPFMYEALKKFGLPNPFIKWVKTLYKDITGCMLNNGWVSSPYNIKRGIRQGCPLSSLIFVIAVEILSCRIRQDNNIKGFQIKLDTKTHSLKISQLADDTTLFLKSKNEVRHTLNIIEIFGTLSGLKLNRSKTEGIWLGKLKHCKDKFENITWNKGPIKSLGVYFGTDRAECDKLNTEKIIQKCDKLISNWKKRNLTMIGKITVVKSLLIPNLTYLASVTNLPHEFIQQFKTIIYNFIWDGKREKVKRTTLSKNTTMGGLKMTDIDNYITALQIAWIKRLTADDFANRKSSRPSYLRRLTPKGRRPGLTLNNIQNVRLVVPTPRRQIAAFRGSGTANRNGGSRPSGTGRRLIRIIPIRKSANTAQSLRKSNRQSIRKNVNNISNRHLNQTIIIAKTANIFSPMGTQNNGPSAINNKGSGNVQTASVPVGAGGRPGGRRVGAGPGAGPAGHGTGSGAGQGRHGMRGGHGGPLGGHAGGPGMGGGHAGGPGMGGGHAGGPGMGGGQVGGPGMGGGHVGGPGMGGGHAGGPGMGVGHAGNGGSHGMGVGHAGNGGGHGVGGAIGGGHGMGGAMGGGHGMGGGNGGGHGMGSHGMISGNGAGHGMGGGNGAGHGMGGGNGGGHGMGGGNGAGHGMGGGNGGGHGMGGGNGGGHGMGVGNGGGHGGGHGIGGGNGGGHGMGGGNGGGHGMGGGNGGGNGGGHGMGGGNGGGHGMGGGNGGVHGGGHGMGGGNGGGHGMGGGNGGGHGMGGGNGGGHGMGGGGNGGGHGMGGGGNGGGHGMGGGGNGGGHGMGGGNGGGHGMGGRHGGNGGGHGVGNGGKHGGGHGGGHVGGHGGNGGGHMGGNRGTGHAGLGAVVGVAGSKGNAFGGQNFESLLSTFSNQQLAKLAGVNTGNGPFGGAPGGGNGPFGGASGVGNGGLLQMLMGQSAGMGGGPDMVSAGGPGGPSIFSAGGQNGASVVSSGASKKPIVVSSGGTVEIGIHKGQSGQPKLVINPSNSNTNNNNNNNLNNNLNGYKASATGGSKLNAQQNPTQNPVAQIFALQQAGLDAEEIMRILPVLGGV